MIVAREWEISISISNGAFDGFLLFAGEMIFNFSPSIATIQKVFINIIKTFDTFTFESMRFFLSIMHFSPKVQVLIWFRLEKS